MPVSLGEWRVRIGTFMRRRRKEYDYHYFWRKLHNLMKKAKNAEPPEENNNSECNISSRTGSSPDANRSPSNTARQSASSAQTGHLRDVNNGGGNASSPTLSQSDVTECDTVKESGFPCGINYPGHSNVSHSESSCAQSSGSSIEKETNLAGPDTTDVTIPVPRPCVEDELDNNDIAINLMSHEYIPKPAQINKTDKPEVGTSESNSLVPADVHGETDRINREKEETADSAPSRKEDQSSDLSPKHRLDTTMNTDQRTSSIREVTEYHGSPIYPVLGSGTSSGEADAIKGNDCPDMNNILLLRSGDVERNPGPNDKPGNLTDLELYLLADSMDPSDYRTVGLALGFSEAQLSQFEKDKLGDSMHATYQMLYEWRKRVCESEAREKLVVTLQRIKLVQLADSVQKECLAEWKVNVTHNVKFLDSYGIEIVESGYYYLYTQIYFSDSESGATVDPSSQQALPMRSSTNRNHVPLMESVVPFKEYATKYHGGVFHLEKGDRITVSVSNGDLRINTGSDKTFFGVFMLRSTMDQGPVL
eukprot:XP_011676661.1 PREDICTED: uncharacterized protein LOC105444300 [Strongylocentrotus purpuratus]